MSHYLVTAVLQDNREFTAKVCARCVDPWDAMGAIKRVVASRMGDLGADVDPLQVVEETYIILFMHVEWTDELMV